MPLSAGHDNYLPTWKGLLHHLGSAVPLRFVSGWVGSFRADEYCPRHSHRDIEIVYHPIGEGVTGLDHGKAVRFRQGGVVVYAPDEAHDQRTKTKGEDLCLHLEFPAHHLRKPKGAVYVGHVENSLVRAEMESLAALSLPAERFQQSILNYRATAVLLTLLEQACRPPLEETVGEARVRRAEEYIKQHFSTIMSLREVASHSDVSPDYLRHLFQERRRYTLVRHLNEVRVSRASSLLAHSDLAMKEIARQCGFRDVYYFSVVFNRLKGIAPGRYRSKNRTDRPVRSVLVSPLA